MGEYLDIIIFAVIAVALLFRLGSVLGTRNEDEPQSVELPPQLQEKLQNNPALQQILAAQNAQAAPERWAQNLPNFDVVDTATVHNRLAQFLAVDPAFRPDDFLEKAKKAFGMIVEAFANGNRGTLQFLLSPGLYQFFADQIDARDANHETYSGQLNNLKKAIITDATLSGSQARVTVDFTAEQSISRRDKNGQVIDGQDGQRRVMYDRWVFSKDLKDTSPNWLLVDTLAYDE